MHSKLTPNSHQQADALQQADKEKLKDSRPEGLHYGLRWLKPLSRR